MGLPLLVDGETIPPKLRYHVGIRSSSVASGRPSVHRTSLSMLMKPADDGEEQCNRVAAEVLGGGSYLSQGLLALACQCMSMLA